AVRGLLDGHRRHGSVSRPFPRGSLRRARRYAGGVIPRDAATVMLVRGEADGLEVFMLRRNLTSVFVAGACVFPGGAVAESDGAPEMAARCRGRTDAAASATLGLPRGGAAFWVAAVR